MDNTKEILRLARRIKKEQGDWTDQWVAENVIAPYTEIADGLVSQAMVAAKAVQELGGTLTIPRVRRLYNVRTLNDTISAQVSNLSLRVLNQLSNESEKIYKQGMRHAAELAATMIVPKDYLEDFVEQALERTPVDLDRVNLPQTALPTKAHRLGPTIGEKMEYKFAQTMALTQGSLTDTRIEEIIEDVIGTGLMFLIGMMAFALWNTWTAGGIFFGQIHDWIEGWMWHSTLDNKTCPSCIWLHGQHFNTDEVFYDHPHGRCMPIPWVVNLPPWIEILGLPPDVIGGDDISPPEVEQTGEEWFNQLPADIQEQILGSATYRAWIAGAIRLEDLSAIHQHDVYGQIRVRASLRSLLGEGAERFYK